MTYISVIFIAYTYDMPQRWCRTINKNVQYTSLSSAQAKRVFEHYTVSRKKYLPRSWDKDWGEKILLPTLIDPKSEMETSSFISKISIHQLLAMRMEEKGSKIYNQKPKKSSSRPYVSIVF